MGRRFDTTVALVLLLYGISDLVQFGINYANYVLIAQVLSLLLAMGSTVVGAIVLGLVILEEYTLGKLEGLSATHQT